MKRTKELHLGLLASVAAATLSLSGCGPENLTARRCVDPNQRIVDDRFCADQNQQGPVASSGFYPYRWYYGGSGGYIPPGEVIRGGSFDPPSGASSFSQPTTGTTVRGVFGGSAGGHGDAAGAGE